LCPQVSYKPLPEVKSNDDIPLVDKVTRSKLLSLQVLALLYLSICLSMYCFIFMQLLFVVLENGGATLRTAPPFIKIVKSFLVHYSSLLCSTLKYISQFI
jgi:hypothetical protein